MNAMLSESEQRYKVVGLKLKQFIQFMEKEEGSLIILYMWILQMRMDFKKMGE